MYISCDCADAGLAVRPRSYDGLGFAWAAVVPTAISVGSSLFGGEDRMSVADYYPPTQRGVQLCPGDFSVPQVEALIGALPAFRSEVDSVVAMDPAFGPGGEYAATTPKGKAAVLVNIAHGGRDCTNKPKDTQGHAAIALIVNMLRAASSEPPTYGGAPVQPLPSIDDVLGPVPTWGGSGFELSPSEQERLAAAPRMAMGAPVMLGLLAAAAIVMIDRTPKRGGIR